MRRAARVDENQPEIVKALIKCGCTVQHLHAVGKGCPDILVGHRNTNYLLEIKDGAKSPSRQKLTPDQIEWIEKWRGNVRVVNCVEDALNAVGVFGPSFHPGLIMEGDSND